MVVYMLNTPLLCVSPSSIYLYHPLYCPPSHPFLTSLPPLLSRQVYKIPMTKEAVLTTEQADRLFPGLEELILFHSELLDCTLYATNWYYLHHPGGLCNDLKEHTALTNNGVVMTIADVLLQRVSCSVPYITEWLRPHSGCQLFWIIWRRWNRAFQWPFSSCLS